MGFPKAASASASRRGAVPASATCSRGKPAPRTATTCSTGPEGSKVFVDPKSSRFIDGTTLDYDTSLVSKGFIFNNPNAKSTCGCGTSFQCVAASFALSSFQPPLSWKLAAGS